ncbi:MAG: GSCFA domain-containing protein [Ginsengibacter sp.]
MELLLPFQVASSSIKISYTDKILFIGSCFSEEIGKHMKDLKFDLVQNPNGILYDPLSISGALTSYIQNKQFAESDLYFLHELWHSWDHHSIFSGPDKQQVLQNINRARSGAHQYLQGASWVIITLGTSYHYYFTESQIPVANCHKAPSSFFQKKILEIELIIAKLTAVISDLQSFNTNLKIIFTISPVRHVRDGVIENNRSKARLIEAIHSITGAIKNVFYFPAYELIIDVLRDYRFYKDDLVHPTEAATTFVFENFCHAYIDEGGNKLLKEIQQIVAAVNHKPFQEESTAHKKFLAAQLEKIKKIAEKFPSIDFSNEIEYFLR